MDNQLPDNNQTSTQSPTSGSGSAASLSPINQGTTQTQQPPGAPEIKENRGLAGSLFKEGEPRVIEKKDFEPTAEVKEWVSEVKEAEEITLPQPIKDEYGQILMEAATPVKPRIVLPLSQPKTQQALHKKIIESIRWLAEWCLRLLKMFPKRVDYGSDN